MCKVRERTGIASEPTRFAIQKTGNKNANDAHEIVEWMDALGKFQADPPKISPLSQDSKNKLQRGIMIENNDLVAFVRNTAGYAWAIKTGEFTINNLAYGTHTSTVLLWNPLKKAANQIIDVLADDLINKARNK